MRSAFFHWYATDEIWEAAEPIFLAWDGRAYSRAQATSPAASSHPQPSSAASPACAAPRLSVQSVPCLAKQMSASKFLATLEEAAYDREDNPAQATLLRELANSLSSGDLLLMQTDEVWDLDEEQREEKAIAKLDKLIELVVSMRTAWIASPLGAASWNAGRHLGPLEGDMSGRELRAVARDLLRSMSMEKRREYAFCFQASGSQQFLFALLRQPSFFKAEGLEKLLEEWANIKNSSEYNEAIEQRKRRTELQTKQKEELQNLRMQINRKRRSSGCWAAPPPPLPPDQSSDEVGEKTGKGEVGKSKKTLWDSLLKRVRATDPPPLQQSGPPPLTTVGLPPAYDTHCLNDPTVELRICKDRSGQWPWCRVCKCWSGDSHIAGKKHQRVLNRLKAEAGAKGGESEDEAEDGEVEGDA